MEKIITAQFENVDFAEAAAAEARKLRDHMTILLSTYGAI